MYRLRTSGRYKDVAPAPSNHANELRIFIYGAGPSLGRENGYFHQLDVENLFRVGVLNILEFRNRKNVGDVFGFWESVIF